MIVSILTTPCSTTTWSIKSRINRLRSSNVNASKSAVTGPQRDAIYAELAALRPTFGGYQDNTTRMIPVVELKRTLR